MYLEWRTRLLMRQPPRGCTRRREFEACNLSSHLCEFRHAHLERGAATMSTQTMVGLAAALVLGAATAAAMINYEVNAPLAAF